jgi:hypothetical protein
MPNTIVGGKLETIQAAVSGGVLITPKNVIRELQKTKKDYHNFG